MISIRQLICVACALGCVLWGNAAAAPGGASVSDTLPAQGEKPIMLDKVVVEASRDYQPIEPGWSLARTSHFDLYARDATSGRKIADSLIELRGILEIVWPAVLTIREVPTMIVACQDPKEFHDWTSRPETDLSCTAVDSTIHLIVNADIAEIQGEARRAYLLILLNRVPGMRRWLAGGIADIIRGAEYADGRIRIGENKRPGLTQLSNADLIYLISIYDQIPDKDDILKQEDVMRMARGGGRFKLTLRTPVIYPKGYPETVGTIIREMQEELALRKNNYSHNDPSRGFAEFFEADQSARLSLIFDPATPDTPQFRMFSWAFVHLSLYGFDNKYTKNLFRFIGLLDAGQPTEQAFQTAYGVSTDKFETLLRDYANTGQYKIGVFKLTNKTLPAEAIQFQPVGDAEILPVKATVLIKTGQTPQAKALLTRACAYRVSRSNQSLCLLAGLTEDPKEALTLLESAAKSGPLDANGSYLLAKSRLDTAPRPLSPRQIFDILSPAFAALKQEGTPQTYVLIADVWLASAVAPTEANLAVVDEGARLFPNEPTLKGRVEALRQRFPKTGEKAAE